MKNVTGLDLPKLMAGSHGTLGLLTEVALKVWPKVEAQATLVIHGLDPTRAAQAMAAAMATPHEPTGAAHLPMGAHGIEGPATCLRLEGFESSVQRRVASLRDALRDFGEMTTLDESASEALWRAVRDAAPLAGEAGPIWRASLPPMAGAAFADAVSGQALFDWQGGLVWLAGTGDDASAIHRAVAAHGGHARLMRGALDEASPASGETATALADQVRRAFDPVGVFADAPHLRRVG